ncbi:hypothetical protein GCM10020254_37440 [Streptomyces goshikiensis]
MAKSAAGYSSPCSAPGSRPWWERPWTAVWGSRTRRPGSTSAPPAPAACPPVGEAEFTRFLDREVTPAFPEGLTLQDGRGQWRGPDGKTVHETSYEVVLLYPEKEAESRGVRIERIRRAYEGRYRQDSVGRSDDKVSAGF